MADTVGGISGLTRTHLPTYSIDDAGKYLKIDANGNPIFYTETPGGIVTEAGANAANDVGAATGATTALKLANLTANASETQEGVAELATAAEIVTGTDTGRVPNVANLKTALASDGMWLTKRTKMPDGATVETYKSNFSAGVDGWASSGGDTDLSASGGELIAVANKSGSTQVAMYKTITIPAGYTVRIIMRRASGVVTPGFSRIAYRRVSDSSVVTIANITLNSANDSFLVTVPEAGDRIYVYFMVGAAYTTADTFRISSCFIGSSSNYLTGTLSEEAARIADQLGDTAGVGVAASGTITSNGTNVNTPASGILTTTGSLPTGDATFQVGTKTYKWVTGKTPDTEGEVLIGASAADCMTNAKNAINGDAGTKGSTHFCTANTLVTAASDATKVTVTAILRGTVGNGATYQLVANAGSEFTASGALMTGGVDDTVTVGGKTYKFVGALTASPGVEGEVLVGSTAGTSLTNFVYALSWATAGNLNGIRYWAAAAHPLVSSFYTSGVLTLTALLTGELGNSITLAKSTSATTLTLANANGTTGNPINLSGGYSDAAAKIINATKNNIAGGMTRPAAAQVELTNNALIGYETTVDVASGATFTLPAGGTWIWNVYGYGATISSAKRGSSAGGTTLTVASANASVGYRRYA